MERHRQSRAVVAALLCAVIVPSLRAQTGVPAQEPARASAQSRTDRADATSVPRITQDEFRALHADGRAYVVDVRVAVSYVAGRIPGAASVPLDEVLGRADEILALAGNRTVVTYCSCPSEHTSAQAGLILLARGGKDVRALVGGYIDWVRNGGKIER